MGGLCGGCGANFFLAGAMLLWFAIKAVGWWLYGDEKLSPQEVVARAVDAFDVWLKGCSQGKCVSEGNCCKGEQDASTDCRAMASNSSCDSSQHVKKVR